LDRDAREGASAFDCDPFTHTRLRTPIDVAKLTQRLLASGRFGKSLTMQIVDAHIEVKRKLFANIRTDIVGRSLEKAEHASCMAGTVRTGHDEILCGLDDFEDRLCVPLPQ